ncbi:MAG TPA: peptidylprolyl isomerase [Polyangiaceae bacterium]|nr:peptidylprolyl isomerase [Polyangiaceae bacterium]
MRPARHGLFAVAALLALGACHDRYQEMQEQAAASASAAAAASASALAAALASAAAAPKPAKKPPESIRAQQILIAYKGAQKAPKKVTRTKEAARRRAEEVRVKATDAEFDFTELARQYSDDPSGQDREGTMGTITRNDVMKEIADAAFALDVDQVSGVVETPFGFHVLKRNQ